MLGHQHVSRDARHVFGKVGLAAYHNPVEVVKLQRQVADANTASVQHLGDGIAHTLGSAAVHDLTLASFAHLAGQFQVCHHDAVHGGQAIRQDRMHQAIVATLGNEVDLDTISNMCIAAVMPCTVGVGTVTIQRLVQAVHLVAETVAEQVLHGVRVQLRQYRVSGNVGENVIQADAFQCGHLATVQVGGREPRENLQVQHGRGDVVRCGTVAVDGGNAALTGLGQRFDSLGLLGGGAEGLAVQVGENRVGHDVVPA